MQDKATTTTKDMQINIKPDSHVASKMCELAGVPFPMPVQYGLEEGTEYWVAVAGIAGGPLRNTWKSDDLDRYWLKSGLIQRTRDGAIQHSLAIGAANQQALKRSVETKDATSPTVAKSSLQTQIGGEHYKDAAIQPIQFIVANNIPFREANVIKYVFRHTRKNGRQDLLKARHYIDMILEDYCEDAPCKP